MVEQVTVNHRVAGSSPAPPAKSNDRKCQHDWHTNGLGVTYCWNCLVEKAGT